MANSDKSYHFFNEPFPHFIWDGFLPPDQYQLMCNKFDAFLAYGLNADIDKGRKFNRSPSRISDKTERYSAYIFQLDKSDSAWCPRFFTQEFKKQVQKIFNLSLTNDLSIAFHHHPGPAEQSYAHNDFEIVNFISRPLPNWINPVSSGTNYQGAIDLRPGVYQRVRSVALVYYFNNSLDALGPTGGTGLFRLEAGKEILDKDVKPVNNRLLAFAVSPVSHQTFLGSRSARNSLSMWFHTTQEVTRRRFNKAPHSSGFRKNTADAEIFHRSRQALIERKADSIPHLGQSSLTHLEKVYGILLTWGVPHATCLAGLIHNINSTVAFQKAIFSLQEREKAKSVFGERAEWLAYLYSGINFQSFWPNPNSKSSFSVFHRFENKNLDLDRTTVVSIAAMYCANIIEQRMRFANRRLSSRQVFHFSRFLSPEIQARIKYEYQRESRFAVPAVHRFDSAVVTGANRGLGLCLTKTLLKRGARVLATYRNENSIAELSQLRTQYPEHLRLAKLEVRSEADIATLDRHLREFGSPKLVINNAAVSLQPQAKLHELSYQAAKDLFEVNALGPLFVLQKIMPFLKEKESSVVINISSGLASIENSYGSFYVYRASKAALNMLNASLRTEFPKAVFLSISPGSLKTDMGGKNATGDPSEAAEKIIALAERATSDQSGLYFDLNGQSLQW